MKRVHGARPKLSFATLAAVLLVASAVAPISLAAARTGTGLDSTGNAPFEPPAAAVVSPHAGELDADYMGPGLETVDPAVAVFSPDAEPILNVYETLVSYAGNSTSSYVPTLAVCVPGTEQCGLDFSSWAGEAPNSADLVTSDSTGPIAFTFVIDNAARFYDGSTQVAWPVYPSDVMFSVARDLAYANPSKQWQAGGWGFGEALLPFGNGAWDINQNTYLPRHFPENNTPLNILSSMLVNDTAYCPPTALASENGCVTFLTTGEGQNWPYFLGFVADALGGGIASCGWVSQNGGGLPGWPGSNAASGDGPCDLPGGSSSTSGTGFQGFLSEMTEPSYYTYWDSYEDQSNNFPGEGGNLRWGGVGSGPYWIAGADYSGYALEASPGYQQPSGCVGSGGLSSYSGGCDPPPQSYVPKVHVGFSSNDLYSLGDFQAKSIDFGTVDLNDIANWVAAESEGYLTINPINTYTSFLLPFNLDWNWNTYKNQIGSDPPVSQNFPADFFTGLAARQVLTESYEYSAAENGDWTEENIPAMTEAGGPIPAGMSGYYPTNVTWPYELSGGFPGTDPTVVGSAAWWWTQGTTNPVASNPYYDPELAQCLNVTCQFPIEGYYGETQLDTAIMDWIYGVESITHQHVQPVLDDATMPFLNGAYTLELAQLSEPPGSGAFPIWNIGWTGGAGPSSYSGPDPEDLEEMMEDLLDSLFGDDEGDLHGALPAASAGISPAISAPSRAAPAGALTSCPGSSLAELFPPVYPEDPTNFLTAEAYPDNAFTYSDAVCEQMNSLLTSTNIANCGHDSGSFVDLAYWAKEAQLPTLCQGVAYSAALGGMEFAQQDPNVAERELYYNLAEHILNALALYVNVGQAQSYLGAAPWIDQASLNYNPAIGGAGDQLWFNVQYISTPVTFVETGLPTGQTWSVTVHGWSPITESDKTTTSGGSVSFVVPNGMLSFAISPPYGYDVAKVTGTSGSNPTSTTAQIQGATTLTVHFSVPSVRFSESGLPLNVAWGVRLDSTDGGADYMIQGVTTAKTSHLTQLVAADTYAYSYLTVPGYHIAGRYTPGTVVALGVTPRSIAPVAFVPTKFTVEFLRSGASGKLWGVTLNGIHRTTTGGTLKFSEPNGSYSFQITPPATGGWLATPSSGTITVQGSAVTEVITFTDPPIYDVTFDETGLPSGTDWTAAAGTSTNASSGSLASFPAVNGTLSYTVSPVAGYEESNATGIITVNGSPVSVPIHFTPESSTYNVSFVGEGIPAGLAFQVLVASSTGGAQTLVSSLNGTATVPELDGPYNFTVTTPAGYNLTSWAGNLTVDGASVSIPLVFADSFPVTIAESGLPPGATWSSWLDPAGFGLTGGSVTSNASSTYQVPDGNYTWWVGPIPGYTVANSSGNITVNGSATTVSVGFQPAGATYSLTLAESGLPSGTAWNGTVNSTSGGLNVTFETATSSVTIPEENGTYSWSVGGVPTYNVTEAGTVTVAGGGVCQPVTFSPDIGYPSISVLANRSYLGGENGGSFPLAFTVPAGTTHELYAWELGGNFSTFSPPTLPRGMTVETTMGNGGIAIGALPAGTYSTDLSYSGWINTVAIAIYGISNDTWDGYGFGSEGQSTNLSLPPGAFAYLGVEGTGGTYPVTHSSLTTVDVATGALNGGEAALIGRQSSSALSFATSAGGFGIDAVGIYPGFAGSLYPLRITESGLAAGTSWSVTIGGQMRTSTNTTITFELLNGSSGYQVSALSGYVASPGSGVVQISGAGTAVSISFTPVYSVTFAESGLPSGTQWAATLGSTTEYSTTASIVFSEASGSYSFKVANAAGDVPQPSSGSVTVSGGSVSESIAFAPPPIYTATFKESGLPSGAQWEVSLGSTNKYSTTASIVFSVGNGSQSYDVPNADYTYTSHSVTWYTASPYSGTVTIAGANVVVSITFTYHFAVICNSPVHGSPQCIAGPTGRAMPIIDPPSDSMIAGRQE